MFIEQNKNTVFKLKITINELLKEIIVSLGLMICYYEAENLKKKLGLN